MKRMDFNFLRVILVILITNTKHVLKLTSYIVIITKDSKSFNVPDLG